MSSALHLYFLPKSESVIGRQRVSEQPHPLPAPSLDNVLFMGPDDMKRQEGQQQPVRTRSSDGHPYHIPGFLCHPQALNSILKLGRGNSKPSPEEFSGL